MYLAPVSTTCFGLLDLSFFLGRGERGDGCKVMDTCEWKYLQEYDFFVWGFVLEKINLKNFLNINETG